MPWDRREDLFKCSFLLNHDGQWQVAYGDDRLVPADLPAGRGGRRASGAQPGPLPRTGSPELCIGEDGQSDNTQRICHV